MKSLFKKLTMLILVFALFAPIFVSAADSVDTSGFVQMSLEEALEEEGIEYSFTHTDNADQVVIYLFRGRGCGYCHKFLEYAANTLMPQYGNKIRFVTFEVWYNDKNGALYEGVANTLGASADGVPFIIIGDKYFTGYSESMNSDIIAKIESEYASSNRYDVIEEYLNSLSNNKKESKNGTKVDLSDAIIWNFIFTSISTIIIIAFINNRYKKLAGITPTDEDEYDEPELETKKSKK